MAPKRIFTNFELLSFFLKLEILIRLANHSSDAIHSFLRAIPTRDITKTVTNPEVFRNMNLHHLTVQSLSLLSNYQDLIDRCVAAGNLEAHYLRGMQEYFQKENITEGLAHLQIALGFEHTNLSTNGDYTGSSYIPINSAEEEIDIKCN
ncbi:hypothetical protein Bca4012_027309 [Brassica carinata]